MGVLGSRLRRLTLVTVVTRDRAWGDLRLAKAELEALAAGLPGPSARTLVLFGRPREALTEFAALEGYGIVVVGAAGREVSQQVLDRAAGHLPLTVRRPVLVCGADQAATVTQALARPWRMAPVHRVGVAVAGGERGGTREGPQPDEDAVPPSDGTPEASRPEVMA